MGKINDQIDKIVLRKFINGLKHHSVPIKETILTLASSVKNGNYKLFFEKPLSTFMGTTREAPIR